MYTKRIVINKFITRERKITALDIKLAKYFFPYLCELARDRQRQTYDDFLKTLRRRHPKNSALKNSIPLNIGRRFEFIRLFTIDFDLPDLTVWVTNKRALNSDEYVNDFSSSEQRYKSSKEQ